MTQDANTWRPVASTQPVRVTGRGAAARVSKAPEGLGVAGANRAAQYRRARNGLPMKPNPNHNWRQRLLRNQYVWFTVVMTGVFVALGYLSFRTIGDGVIEELRRNAEHYQMPSLEATWPQVIEAYQRVALLALPTLLVYVLVFILIDRLRPTTWTMKYLALGWGATVAVWVSLHVNTWAGELMQTVGPNDASSGARAAIFSAPFVEEAAKATILFILAILLRRRMVAIHQVFTLAGLSAVGFAFTENIVYYLRIFIWTTRVPGDEVQQTLDSTVHLRGLVTSFGHPLFTSFIALGLIVGLLNRSKWVRVLAPVTGYLAAAFGHMLFNGLATVSGNVLVMAIGGWAAVAVLLAILGFRYVTQIRNIRARLTEMVQLGWLQPSDPLVFSSFFGRWRMVLAAFLRGPRVLINTLRLQRDLTELAHLREAELRGIVDAMAIERERDLILSAEVARVWAIDQVRSVPIIPREWGESIKAWRQRRRDLRAAKKNQFPPPNLAQWAAPSGAPAAAGTPSWPAPGR